MRQNLHKQNNIRKTVNDLLLHLHLRRVMFKMSQAIEETNLYFSAIPTLKFKFRKITNTKERILIYTYYVQ